ncbi:hypothetical protein UMM65_04185 [Aureibaculum sp. 2210JD6-5]|uniref:hypothetical protein n=1 Tax=Aureibaculum sp. 2210JD6-5 TaxID=3103957 RepID=UPI002AAEE75F|nr:hypothetical protein [Aureibaculum sp. 2210JD6-5]MDY7394428.1 hypothetical protein [Aureibaculum sp. 2210JD6-5]
MILFSRFLIPKNYTGLAIYPFIFLKNRSLSNNWVLINHERIHLKQQLELLWVFFFIWYTLEFLFHLIRLRNWTAAYKNISFEKEAYENEGNPNYLNERKFWSFINYL